MGIMGIHNHVIRLASNPGFLLQFFFADLDFLQSCKTKSGTEILGSRLSSDHSFPITASSGGGLT